MKKNFTLPAFLILTILIIAGCTGAATSPTPDKLATIVASTLTAVSENILPVLATLQPATIPPPQATPTPATVSVRYIYTQALNVNLRVNPGTFFKVSRVLSQGTKLQLLGIAPGKRWFNVINDEGIIGWVGVDFVSGGFDGGTPPLVSPTDAQIVTGKVSDANGAPVSGIGFALVQDSLREDTTTDETGTFYAYLPLSFSGTWNVDFISIDCKSPVMDSNCQCLSGICKTDPLIATVTLPLSAPLSFVWR